MRPERKCSEELGCTCKHLVLVALGNSILFLSQWLSPIHQVRQAWDSSLSPILPHLLSQATSEVCGSYLFDWS